MRLLLISQGRKLYRSVHSSKLTGRQVALEGALLAVAVGVQSVDVVQLLGRRD